MTSGSLSGTCSGDTVHKRNTGNPVGSRGQKGQKKKAS